MARIAFVFAGQGAQYPGMGADLYDACLKVRDIFDAAEKKLPGITRICFEGTKEELGRTINTQPCLFLTETAIASMLMDAGIKAERCAGFSAGEIASLHYSKVMDFDQAFDYTLFRARAMDEAAGQNKGKMAAVLKLAADDVIRICSDIGNVWPVNFNSPGQTVISGSPDSIERAIETVCAAGGKARLLDVSGAFHSPFMADAAKAAAAHLARIALNKPGIPVYLNISGEILTEKVNDMADRISGQISSPVMWEKTVRSMIRDGADTFVEIGPGEVLSGLIRRIDPAVDTMSTGDAAGIATAVSKLLNTEVRDA